eukprot:Selendium_serpulae@DN4512_c0_g1_i7.p1
MIEPSTTAKEMVVQLPILPSRVVAAVTQAAAPISPTFDTLFEGELRFDVGGQNCSVPVKLSIPVSRLLTPLDKFDAKDMIETYPNAFSVKHTKDANLRYTPSSRLQQLVHTQQLSGDALVLHLASAVMDLGTMMCNGSLTGERKQIDPTSGKLSGIVGAQLWAPKTDETASNEAQMKGALMALVNFSVCDVSLNEGTSSTLEFTLNVKVAVKSFNEALSAQAAHCFITAFTHLLEGTTK